MRRSSRCDCPGLPPAYLHAMRPWISTLLLLLLALNTGWFVAHSAGLGWQGLTAESTDDAHRVFFADAPVANSALALHMIAGAVLTIGAPLQVLPVVRQRWNGVHRRSGYALVLLAMLTGVGGLIYILLQGTVGGWWMSLWFTIYGAAMIGCAYATVHFATRQDIRQHFAWATRLVILAVGSWIYRMHYVIWYSATDGLWSNREFTGAFDLVQVVAFFVPYLLIAEMLLRRTTTTSVRA
ncbi:MAG: DUF2306 domain-containing protein [Pseudomonadota bacterium]